MDYAANSVVAGSVMTPRHKSVPEDSCAYAALREGRAVTGAKELWTVGGGSELYVSVVALPLSVTADGDARVLALLTIG